MHTSFPYDSNRNRDYGVRRSDVLIQSHPGLETQDSLTLHNALASAVDDGQVRPSIMIIIFRFSVVKLFVILKIFSSHQISSVDPFKNQILTSLSHISYEPVTLSG